MPKKEILRLLEIARLPAAISRSTPLRPISGPKMSEIDATNDGLSRYSCRALENDCGRAVRPAGRAGSHILLALARFLVENGSSKLRI